MSERGCARPIDPETLIAYWLAELSPEDEQPLEEHLFACASCARRLEALAALSSGIRAAVREGRVEAVISNAFLQTLIELGLRVREYRLAPGTAVNCSLRAEDDAVVARLAAPLAGVSRLDALVRLETGDAASEEMRLEDLPFDAEAGEVLRLPSAMALRAAGAHRLHLRLLSVEATGERVLADYRFIHAAD